MIHTFENLFFDVIQRIPERFIPQFLMECINRYLNKRISEMQHQIIKYRWQEVELEKTVQKLHMAADVKEAPSDI